MPFLGSFRNWYRYQVGMVPVPPMQRQNGTGTKQSGTSTTHQNRLVPIPVQVVPVPLLPIALISYISTLLSSNSYTDSIETLVND